MRILAFCLLLAPFLYAEDAKQEAAKKKVVPVSEEEAKEALAEFKTAFRVKDIEARQNAVYDLHDVPHPLVLKELSKVLRNKDPRVRNVAALAVGGHGYDVAAAGKVLMQSFKKDYKTEEVLGSILRSVTELGFLGYWPDLEKGLKDKRNAVVIWSLGTLGENKDYRAIPILLEMFHVAMPKKVSWSTGEVKVDTGAAGTADADAAKAKFNSRYGAGGSKMKAKAKAKARNFDERNFDDHLRKAVKQITGESFDTDFDFEDWYIENYIMVHRKIAEMEGRSADKAERKARKELPELKAKADEKRKKLEEQLAKERKKSGK